MSKTKFKPANALKISALLVGLLTYLLVLVPVPTPVQADHYMQWYCIAKNGPGGDKDSCLDEVVSARTACNLMVSKQVAPEAQLPIDFSSCMATYSHGNNGGGGNTPPGFDPRTNNPCIDAATGEEDPDCNGLTKCGDVWVSINVGCNEGEDNPIMAYLTAFINFLAVTVPLIIVAVIVVAGVQYIYAKGNPQQTEQAKSKITNAIIALIGFIFLWAFLQWLVPGGVF